MRYLLFGDSIAWGHADILNRGWAGRLKKHIHKNIIKEKREGNHFINYAVSGYTSKDLLKIIERKIRKRLKKHKNEEFTIIIAIGANDSRLNHKKGVPKKEFKKNILKLIEISKKYANNTFIFGILPVNEELLQSKKNNYHYYNKRIIEYDKILKKCAKKEKVKFKEFFRYWIRKDTKKLFNDGLHPNKFGHELYFEEIKEFLFKSS